LSQIRTGTFFRATYRRLTQEDASKPSRLKNALKYPFSALDIRNCLDIAMICQILVRIRFNRDKLAEADLLNLAQAARQLRITD